MKIEDVEVLVKQFKRKLFGRKKSCAVISIFSIIFYVIVLSCGVKLVA